jgi:hypothetical protein
MDQVVSCIDVLPSIANRLLVDEAIIVPATQTITTPKELFNQ